MNCIVFPARHKTECFHHHVLESQVIQSPYYQIQKLTVVPKMWDKSGKVFKEDKIKDEIIFQTIHFV